MNEKIYGELTKKVYTGHKLKHDNTIMVGGVAYDVRTGDVVEDAIVESFTPYYTGMRALGPARLINLSKVKRVINHNCSNEDVIAYSNEPGDVKTLGELLSTLDDENDEIELMTNLVIINGEPLIGRLRIYTEKGHRCMSKVNLKLERQAELIERTYLSDNGDQYYNYTNTDILDIIKSRKYDFGVNEDGYLVIKKKFDSIPIKYLTRYGSGRLCKLRGDYVLDDVELSLAITDSGNVASLRVTNSGRFSHPHVRNTSLCRGSIRIPKLFDNNFGDYIDNGLRSSLEIVNVSSLFAPTDMIERDLLREIRAYRQNNRCFGEIIRRWEAYA